MNEDLLQEYRKNGGDLISGSLEIDLLFIETP